MAEKTESILKELENSKGYEAALLTTFNFEIDFFEHFVFSLLVRNSIRRINLFVDTDQLNAALTTADSRLLGRHYHVSPIHIDGAFHPKVILLLGEQKAKLIVSSANLKTSGYTVNNEIYNVFTYSDEDTEYGSLIRDAIHFFQELQKITPSEDKDLHADLQKLCNPKVTESSSPYFLSNLHNSILDQLKEYIQEPVRKIRIAVPFYDPYLEALRSLKESFQCSNAEIFLQNKTNTFPFEMNLRNHVIPESAIHAFQKIAYNGTKTFYHGKVLEFITEQHSYVLYGSANCSAAALLSTYTNHGNIECCLLVKSTSHANDAFYANFIKDTLCRDNSAFLASGHRELPAFRFLYSVIDRQKNLLLYIACHSSENIQEVQIRSEKVDFGSEKNILLVSVPETIYFTFESSILPIRIICKDTEYDVICWYNFRPALVSYRSELNTPRLSDYNPESNSEEYALYINRLLEALYNNDDWIEYGKKQAAHLTKLKEIDNAEEEDVAKDYLLENDLSDRYLRKSTLYEEAFEKALPFAKRFYSAFGKPIPNDSKKQSHNKNLLNYPEEETKERKATPIEKSLARSIKKHLKRHLLSADADALSYSYYKNLLGVIFDIIHYEFYVSKVIDFMTPEFIIDVKLQYINILLDKYANGESTPDEDDYLIRFALLIIAECSYRKYSSEGADQKLLNRINRLFHIRDDYDSYFEKLNLKEIGIPENRTAAIHDSVENLFGYKTMAQLEQYFQSIYGPDTVLSAANGVFTVDVLLHKQKAPVTLACRYIDEIDHTINGYKLRIRSIIFVYRETASRKISYEIQYSGSQTGKIFRIIQDGSVKNTIKCKRRNNEIIQDFQNTFRK